MNHSTSRSLVSWLSPLVAALAAILAVAPGARADDDPRRIPVQFRLTDPSGAPITGRHDVKLSIYAGHHAGVDADPIWTETHSQVQVVQGHVSVLAGDVLPLIDDATASAIDFGTPKYLGITIGAFGRELVPRHEIVPPLVSHDAANAGDSAALGGLDAGLFLLESDQAADWGLVDTQLTGFEQAIASMIQALGPDASVPDLGTGRFNGRVVWANGEQLRLEPYDGDLLVVEVGGSVLSSDTSATPFAFDWPDDLRQGENPSSSTFYYLYVRRTQNMTLAPFVSKLPPDAGETFHPSDPAKGDPGTPAETRCIGEFYVNHNSAVVRMEHNPLAGEFRLLEFPQGWDTQWPTVQAGQSFAVSQLGTDLPETADAVLLHVSFEAEGAVFQIGHPAPLPLGGGPTAFSPQTVLAGARLQVPDHIPINYAATQNEQFWLPVEPPTPQYAWAAAMEDGSSPQIDHVRLTVLGWRSTH